VRTEREDTCYCGVNEEWPFSRDVTAPEPDRF
jgi:hypothetical protein